jgi:hypothetical protein
MGDTAAISASSSKFKSPLREVNISSYVKVPTKKDTSEKNRHF